MTKDADKNHQPIPRNQVSRLARLGGLGAGVAGNMVMDGARRFAKGDRPSVNDLLLTPQNATRVADELSRLRGAAMKVGQLISMDAGEFIPPELAEILSRLRESAHSMPPQQLRRVLNENWGRDWMRRFKSFDTKPMAAASIGQVHRARTKDGRDLAVKIQYPGVRESIDSDVDNVVALIRLSGLTPKGVDISPLLEEAKRQLRLEADYRAEAENLRRYRDHLAGADDFVTPVVHDDLTTENILAMSYVESAPLETLSQAPQAERDRVVERLMALLLRELFEFRMVQTDPNFANYRIGADGRSVVLLDFGAARALRPELSEGYRALLRAGLDSDGDALTRIAKAMGLAGEDTEPRHEAMLRELFTLTAEPMRAQGAYDFGASDLAQRISDKGVALRTSGFVHVPPPETVFIHRKIAGTYLLATKFAARVDLGALVGAQVRRA